MPRQPGSFACQSQGNDNQCPFPVRRLPAALRLAANDPDSDYLIESRASRGDMSFSAGGDPRSRFDCVPFFETPRARGNLARTRLSDCASGH